MSKPLSCAPDDTLQFFLEELDSADLPPALQERIAFHGEWCQQNDASHEFFHIYKVDGQLRSRLVRLIPGGPAVQICCDAEASHPQPSGMMTLVNQLSDRMPEGLMIATFTSRETDDSIFTYVNQAMADMLGVSKDMLLGRPEQDFLDTIVSSAQRENWLQALKNVNSLSHEVILKHRDGTRFRASLHRNVVIDHSGWFTHAVITCQNLETEILQFENRFILETLKIGSWRRDFESKAWSFSESLFSLLDYPYVDTVPVDLWEQRVPEVEQKKLRDILRRMVETGETCETTVVANIPGNRQKYLKVQGRVIKNQQGEPIEVIGIAEDVTEDVLTRRELENQKALASHQARLASIGELASGVGHEINNPLTIIRGFLEIVRHQLDSVEPNLHEIGELVTKMDDSAGRIEKIVSGLRSLSHVDGVVTESFAPDPILRDTIGFVDEIYRRQGVSLEMISRVPLAARMKGHEGKLQQVLMNLLSNARDATENQTLRKIVVEFFVDGLELVIRVQDNGPGVPKELQERIFDPFFTTKDIGKGTGIGLSMVHSIVEEFVGNVECLNSPLGGAEFRVTLPLQQVSEIGQQPLGTQAKAEPKFCGRVLIVDDEEGVREFLQLMLKQLGLSVEAVCNGREAMERVDVDEAGFDVVITDLTMPEMGGLELVTHLQNTAEKVPNVLLTTGRPDFFFDKDQYPAVVGLLAKPFDLKSVRAKLEELRLTA